MTTTTHCDDQARRRLLRERGRNGIDYVEVGDDRRTLTVHFLAAAPPRIEVRNVRVEGGPRVRPVRVTEVRLDEDDDPARAGRLEVTVDRPGDATTYTLRLVGLGDALDQRAARADFSFQVADPADLDPAMGDACPPPALVEPAISYLAKDYAGFRQLILDRLALLMPDWRERHAADLGIELVELLAYVGDSLSYYQDAVATEAYLDTARRRISVRRHARLVDYRLHEGCNARAWLCLETAADQTLAPAGLAFITDRDGALGLDSVVLRPDDLRAIPPDRYEVFEPAGPEPLRLYAAHNCIRFYTWGDRECCLPVGATAATLRDGAPGPAGGEGAAGDAGRLRLRAGDVLIFEEILGPQSGLPADADPARRHAVRLTGVERGRDNLVDQPVVEITWAAADALPFPLCLSAITGAPECRYVEDVSVARGNVLLVDHGRTVPTEGWDGADAEALGTVQGDPGEAPCDPGGCGEAVPAVPRPFRPVLRRAPPTFREPVPRHGPAARLLRQEPRQAAPQLALLATPPPGPGVVRAGEESWTARPDLLASGPDDHHVVVEMDDDGRAHLRFGDGVLGRRPAVGTVFRATYRVGNGPAGNVGAGAITHLVAGAGAVDGISGVRNPLPAEGGAAPEPLAEAKLFAPGAFRARLERAVTADDYARLAETHPGVQRAAAVLRWRGSWYEAVVAIDPLGTEEPDEHLLADVARHLRRYRRIGHDLAVVPATYVPFDLALTVWVRPDYLRGHVKAALLDRFGDRLLPDGRHGFFHPDALTFGDEIALSALVAAAQSVPGVAGVEGLTVATPDEVYAWPEPDGAGGVTPGPVIRLGPLEVARLDNDPAAPAHGTLTLELRGGR